MFVTFLLEYALVHQLEWFEHSTLFLDTFGVWGHGSRSYPSYIGMVASTGHKKHRFGFTGPKHLDIEMSLLYTCIRKHTQEFVKTHHKLDKWYFNIDVYFLTILSLT